MENSKKIEILNDLLAKNYDAEKGYKEAAENVDDVNLKTMFQDYARQRYDFGHEIKAAIKGMGGEVDKGDTIAAKAHRAWMDLRSFFAGNDEAAVLNEAKRGEENALSNYDEALEELSGYSSVYSTVQRQRNQIQQAISQIEQRLRYYKTV